jgi:exosome complex component RRP40
MGRIQRWTSKYPQSHRIEYYVLTPLQYIPAVGDLVIGTVQRSAADFYYVTLTDYTSNAMLPQLAFEMASKKTRPNLPSGALVYARVSLANRHMDPELECVSASTGKADGLGPLAGGMLFIISIGMARRLLMRKSVEEGKVAVLEELGAAGLAFETAVGRNGKLWVNSENVKTVLAVGRAVKETDENNLSIEQQKKLARKLVKEMA